METPHANGARAPRGMTICDGRGGALTLDLASPEVGSLADACRRLMGCHLPPGASVLKVSTAGGVYLLSTHARADGGLQISNLYDPAERIVLTRDLAEIVVALLERRPSA